MFSLDRRTRGQIVFCGFLLIAGFYLVTEHRAHLLGILPYLIFLICPLMHLFMHHGHGGREHHQPESAVHPKVTTSEDGIAGGGI